MEKEPNRIVLALCGRLERDRMSGFCARVRVLIDESRAGVVICDVAAVYPDAVAMDLLGRLRLAVLRAGCAFQVRGLPRELHELLEECGLDEIVVDDDSRNSG
jgi:anti-anti-sigma regulatory factor